MRDFIRERVRGRLRAEREKLAARPYFILIDKKPGIRGALGRWFAQFVARIYISACRKAVESILEAWKPKNWSIESIEKMIGIKRKDWETEREFRTRAVRVLRGDKP